MSDFGLAKLGPQGTDTHVTTRVMGTHGYAAPEYVSTGNYSTDILSQNLENTKNCSTLLYGIDMCLNISFQSSQIMQDT